MLFATICLTQVRRTANYVFAKGVGAAIAFYSLYKVRDSYLKYALPSIPERRRRSANPSALASADSFCCRSNSFAVQIQL